MINLHDPQTLERRELKDAPRRDAIGKQVQFFQTWHALDVLDGIVGAQMALKMTKIVVGLVAGPTELKDAKVLEIRPRRHDAPRGLGLLGIVFFVSPTADAQLAHEPSFRRADERCCACAGDLTEGDGGKDAANEEM